VIDVADGAHVHVRFGTIEFLFSHVVLSCPRVASSCPLSKSRIHLSLGLRP
jgi:hypothetical protein